MTNDFLVNQRHWERRIQRLQDIAGSRKQAVRWDMDALGCDGEVSAYCYKVGISVENHDRIESEIW